MKYTALAAFIVTLALCCSYLWVDSRLDGFKPPAGAVLHSVSATKLYALDEGSGDTIVLIHGGGGSIDDWTALRSRLRQTSRVITVERPGNGWSGTVPIGA